MSSNFKKKRQRTNDTPRKKGVPVFIYTSNCCNVLATKEPCERTQESREIHEFSRSNLGTWQCGRCRKKCSVTRTKNEVKQEENHG